VARVVLHLLITRTERDAVLKTCDVFLILSIAAILASPVPSALAQETTSSGLPPRLNVSAPKGLIADWSSSENWPTPPTASGLPTARGATDCTRTSAT
jgi:hypothetical protein